MGHSDFEIRPVMHIYDKTVVQWESPKPKGDKTRTNGTENVARSGSRPFPCRDVWEMNPRENTNTVQLTSDKIRILSDEEKMAS